MEGDVGQSKKKQTGKISIHSLRMEGDFLTCGVVTFWTLFQSTPSAWRETYLIRDSLVIGM